MERPSDNAWSVLSPHADATWNPESLAFRARRFFSIGWLDGPLEGERTMIDRPRSGQGAFEVEVTTSGERPTTARVLVTTWPWRAAPEVRARARIAVERMGGAGFDVLLARTERLWQVHPLTGDEGGALVVCAVLASEWLAPILPPEGDRLFGVRGARERFAPSWVVR